MSKQGASYADAGEDRKRKAKKSAGEGRSDPAFRWCNVSLSESDKETITGMDFDPTRFFEWQEGLVSDGYKVTVSRDDRSDCFMVVVVGRRETRSDYNVGVSSRHPDYSRVLLTTMYKFDVLFMGGAIPTEGLSAKGSVWD